MTIPALSVIRYMPRSGYPKDEVFEYNEDTRKTIANLWSKVKIAASNAE